MDQSSAREKSSSGRAAERHAETIERHYGNHVLMGVSFHRLRGNPQRQIVTVVRFAAGRYNRRAKCPSLRERALAHMRLRRRLAKAAWVRFIGHAI